MPQSQTVNPRPGSGICFLGHLKSQLICKQNFGKDRKNFLNILHRRSNKFCVACFSMGVSGEKIVPLIKIEIVRNLNLKSITFVIFGSISACYHFPSR